MFKLFFLFPASMQLSHSAVSLHLQPGQHWGRAGSGQHHGSWSGHHRYGPGCTAQQVHISGNSDRSLIIFLPDTVIYFQYSCCWFFFFFYFFLILSSCSSEDPGQILIQTVKLAFSVTNNVIRLKPPSDLVSPLEQALTQHSGHGTNLIIVLAKYIYHKHDPALPRLAIQLLKRLATVRNPHGSQLHNKKYFNPI